MNIITRTIMNYSKRIKNKNKSYLLTKLYHKGYEKEGNNYEKNKNDGKNY